LLFGFCAACMLSYRCLKMEWRAAQHNFCCHSFAAYTVDVTVCYICQTVSTLSSGLSRYFEQPTPCWLHLAYFGQKTSYEDRKSAWNSGVRKTIRRGWAEEEVHKHRDRVTGAWKQISKQRRRVDVRYDPSMVTALHHGTCMDEEGFKKTCIRETRKRGDIHQPFYFTWVDVKIDFKLYDLIWFFVNYTL